MDPSLSTSNSKFKILKQLIIIVVVIIVLDLALSKILSRAHMTLDRGEYGTINKILTNAQEDIFVFGSSRAKYHYDSLVIERVSGMSCYNAGFNGKGILLSALLMEILLEKRKPKAIILDINFLNKEFNDEFTKLDLLNPYYFDYPQVQDLLDHNSGLEQLKYLSKLYAYNLTIPALIERKIDKEEADKYNGFLKLEGTRLKSSDKFQNVENKAIDKQLLNTLFTACDIAKQKGVKLLVCISPALVRFSDESIKRVQAGLEERGLKLFDFSSMDHFKSRKLFYDAQHLNSFGAEIYSMKIGELLKQ